MDYLKDLSKVNKNSLLIVETLRGGKKYFNEIAEKSGIKSRNNLLKNLNNLFQINAIKKEQNKSNTFYSLNYDNYLTIGLLQLISSIRFESLPFQRKKPITEIISQIKPLIAVLFGSSAKGNFTNSSDIDLLIISDYKNNNRVKEISSRYGVKVNAIFLQLEEFHSKNETISHILKTGYPLTGEIYFYEELKKI